MIADGLRDALDLGMQRRQLRVRIAHHVPVDVAAGCDGVKAGGEVDLLNQRPEVALHDPVKLEGLPRRELERAVGVRIGEPIELEPLGWLADAAGHSDPRHEDEGLFLSFFPPLITKIAIILLIDAVKLGELSAFLRNCAGGGVREVTENISAEVITFRFDLLILMQRLFRDGDRDVFGGGTHAKEEVW
jgi:hypothetical protein